MSTEPGSEEFYPRGSNAAAGRGLALIFVAIAIGLALLKWGLDDTGTAGSVPAKTTSTTSTTTSSTPTGGTTSTTVPGAGQQRPNNSVVVQVANGTATAGLAKKYVEKLAAANFVVPNGLNADNRDTSVVYYAPTYQLEANAVAALAGLQADAVQPLPAGDVTGKGESLLQNKPNILVIIGKDKVTA